MPPSQPFDATHAEGYDRNLERILPIKDTLHLLIRWWFSGLPDAARILVAGAGTAAEARFLAPIFPRWRFTLVDPSEAMLDVGRRHAVAEGFADRCELHVGLVSSLPADGFDAATSVLVSHFLTDAAERQAYFAEIARRLKPRGAPVQRRPVRRSRRRVVWFADGLWLTLAGMPDDRKDFFRAAFGRGLAAHGPAEVEAMIARAGFSPPAPCFQATLIRGWLAVRA